VAGRLLSRHPRFGGKWQTLGEVGYRGCASSGAPSGIHGAELKAFHCISCTVVFPERYCGIWKYSIYDVMFTVIQLKPEDAPE